MKRHITISLRIIARHRNMRMVSVEAAKAEIERLALSPETDRRLVDNLEFATGLPISALAEVARKHWGTTTEGEKQCEA